MRPGGYQGCQGLFIAGQVDLETMAVPIPGPRLFPEDPCCLEEDRERRATLLAISTSPSPRRPPPLPQLSDLVTGSSADL